MSNTVRVRSMAPMAFAISEPHPDPEKPGNSPQLLSAVIKPGVSEVDGDVFKAWSDTKPGFLTDGVVTEMKDDEEEMSFGFEPALKAASTEGASDGSLLKEKGPVSSADMKPTSGAPNDDSPRSQTPSPISNPAPAIGVTPAAKPAAAK